MNSLRPNTNYYSVIRWLSGLKKKKNPPVNAEDKGLIPGLGKSFGVGNVHLFQYSSLENSIDRGTLWATVPGIRSQRAGHD